MMNPEKYTKYKGKEILAWLEYDPKNSEGDHYLLAYPQILVSDKVQQIKSSDFPEHGAIRVEVCGTELNAKTAFELFGSIAIIQINTLNPLHKGNQNHNVNLMYNSKFEPPTASEIWISKFTNKKMNEIFDGFYQVINVDYDMAKLKDERSLPVPEGKLYKSSIMLMRKDKLYGPFELESIRNNMISINAKKEFHYIVGEYDKTISNDIVSFRNNKDEIEFSFIPKKSISFSEERGNSQDWIRDEALIEDFIRFLQYKNSVDNDSKLQPDELTQSFVENNSDLPSNIKGRRYNRINTLIKKKDQYVRDVVKYTLDDEGLKKAFAEEIVKNHFEQIQEKLIEVAPNGLKTNIEKYQKECLSLEQQLKDTVKRFNSEASQIGHILDRKFTNKILKIIDEEANEENTAQYDFDSNLLCDNTLDANKIIDRVSELLEKANRKTNSNDIANYLICITQGFITTFAGAPGTGKTSLCNLLAKALGLETDNKQRRFVEVSVERGWSSHKDFIGYYNPLSKSLERSNEDVFEAFKRMDYEYRNKSTDVAPFIILLDEANLSPIEHYWAPFLRNCDLESVSNRSLSLGGNVSFKLPEYLRFLATVNFDHTTEELSPRFLDRSWIIMLEPEKIEDSMNSTIDNVQGMIPFSALKSSFSIQFNDKMDPQINKVWDQIQDEFKNRSLPIAPRNQKMVRNYCVIASRCMDTKSNPLIPLDYAVAQKILPTINGTLD